MDFYGRVAVGGDFDIASSALEVDFMVDEVGLWELVDAEPIGSLPILVRLIADGDTVFDETGPDRFGAGPFRFLLSPGVDYSLLFAMSTGGLEEIEGGIRWVPVPEPGSALMVGLGLACLSNRRHRFAPASRFRSEEPRD